MLRDALDLLKARVVGLVVDVGHCRVGDFGVVAWSDEEIILWLAIYLQYTVINMFQEQGGKLSIVCLSLRESFVYRNARGIGLAPPESDMILRIEG